MKKRTVLLLVASIVALMLLDYINLPSLLGISTSNINLDFWMASLNIILVIVLYVITFKKIDEKSIEKEENKKTITILLMQKCYKECLYYVGLLNQETVEKYIVPKIDFNSTDSNKGIVSNLQAGPFLNELVIMDLVKDGQVTKAQIEGYFKVKEKYSQYVNMRIALFDAPTIYEPLAYDLHKAINEESKKLDDHEQM